MAKMAKPYGRAGSDVQRPAFASLDGAFALCASEPKDSEPLAVSVSDPRRFPTDCWASPFRGTRNWRAQQDSNLRPPGS